MNAKVFDYKDYKKYLNVVFKPSGSTRGMRSRLAQHLNCQIAFVSQVLGGKAEFSLEHAIRVSEFLKHSSQEKHFFLLIVQYARSGSQSLKDHYLQQIEQILRQREQIDERIGVKKNIAAEDQVTYYSHWLYSAIHIMLSIPTLQTERALAARLKMEPYEVEQFIGFLLSVGLIERSENGYRIGTQRIHLPQNSPLINKHHTNWRIRSIMSLDSQNKNDLHYSAVLSLSIADANRIKKMLLETLEEIEPVLQASPEEDVFGLSMDLFRI